MLQGVNVNLQPERYVVHWASDIIYISLHSHHPNQLTTEVQPFPEKEDLKFYCRVMLQIPASSSRKGKKGKFLERSPCRLMAKSEHHEILKIGYAGKRIFIYVLVCQLSEIK